MWTVFIIGLVGGVMLTVMALRYLGRKAYYSPSCKELFYKITRYKVSRYIINNEENKITATIKGQNDDNTNLSLALNQLGFNGQEAKESVKHTNESASGEPFEEKLKITLRYLGNKPK